MKCDKCGNHITGNECEHCGETLKKYINVVSDNELKIRNKKCNNISALIIAFSISAFLFYIGLGFRMTKDYSIKDKIVFGENEIPSFYKITGNRSITNYHIAKTLEVMKYDTSKLTEEELESYVLALYDNDFHDVSDDEKTIIMIKKAREKNTLLKIEMFSENGTLVLKYEHLNGKLENYGIDENKEIGNNDIGFIDVPLSYVMESKSKYYLKYYNPDNLNEYIIIERINDKTFDEVFINNFTNTCKKRNVTLYGVSGIELIDNYELGYSKTFIFKKDVNDTYCIKLNSNDENAKIFSSIYTYSFNK